ncbi:MAG: hypothetical protein LC632_06465 [Xanthomonadaceae bacterium]|nr:hypothetical protein [Xanthomonadaceae bacterium]
MNDTRRQNSAVLWIAVAVLIAVYAGWMTVQYDRQRDLLTDAHTRHQQLVEQFQALASARPAAPAAAVPEPLLVALLRRPDLIPIEPVLGGTFYYLEDSVRVLSDRHLYVAVEDGHIAGHLLLEYRAASDGGYTFQVMSASQD